jgi:hypothetical protein
MDWRVLLKAMEYWNTGIMEKKKRIFFTPSSTIPFTQSSNFKEEGRYDRIRRE